MKGLGATKVTSLVDAFTKPFIVGGLKRKDKGRAADEVELERTDIVTPTARAALAGAADGSGHGKGKGKGEDRSGAPEGNDREASPDWPDDEEDDGGDDDERSSRRARGPSRSPGLSPETRESGAEPVPDDGQAWRDPLDDDEDDDGRQGEEGDDSPVAKRPKTS